MKIHQKKPSKPHTSNHQRASARDADTKEDLERVAEDLVALARKRLPDKVLRGALTGLEGDIRQDAILLALGWYIREGENELAEPNYPWFAPRAIAAALRFQRLDHAKRRKRELRMMRSVADAETSQMQQHPALLRPCDWSASAMQKVIHEAIGVALKAGRISHANASIAIEVYGNCRPVTGMAEQLGVSRSNIYQHLSRVRREIPDIIDGMEVRLQEPR